MMNTRPWVFHRHGRFWTISSPVGRVVWFTPPLFHRVLWDHGGMTETVPVEIARTFDIDAATALPPLIGVGGVAQVRHRPPTALECVYFDTAGRDLSAHQVTLRRHTGGTDAGWQVTIVRGERRLEMQRPLGSEEQTVPPSILDLVQVHVRGRALAPIARVDTQRRVVDLMDGQGHVLASVSDDRVARLAVGVRAEPRVRHWREWTVEVIDAGRAVLDGVGQVLEAAGARARPAGSAPDPLDPRAPLEVRGDGPGNDGGALGVRAVLTAAVRAQLKALKGWDPLVRCDGEDAVHQYRVCCRTLRSILQIYAPLLETAATEAVVKDLKTLGRLLSVARDAEVVRDQVRERMDALPGGSQASVAALIPGQTVWRLQRSQATLYEAAHARQLRRMRSAWYVEVLERLEAFARRIPLSAALSAEDEPGAAAVMVPLVAAPVDAVLALAGAVGAASDHEERIELMHEVRKEAKRLRYAVQAVQEATGVDFGADLDARFRTAKKLQEVLGEHRDSVLFQAQVRQTAEVAAALGEDTFGYGVLFAAEFAVQARTEAEAQALVGRLADSGRGDMNTLDPHTH